MIKKLKEVSLLQYCLTTLLMLFVVVIGALGNEVKKDIDQKVDGPVLMKMIEVLEVQQEGLKEQQMEQKTIDKETLLLLQQMKIQLLLLNQKMELTESLTDQKPTQ